MEGILHWDSHGFQHRDGLASKVRGNIAGSQVKVGTRVQKLGWMGWITVAEVEELHFGGDKEGEASILRLGQIASQHVTRITLKGAVIVLANIAEHAAGRTIFGPRQGLKSVGIGAGQHIGFLDSAEAVYGRTIEMDALLKGCFQLDWRDSYRLQFDREHR